MRKKKKQQQLSNLRPYQESITAWLASARQDTSYLLRGKSLEDALKWKQGKRLSNKDTDFLDASRDYEVQELKKAKEKANQMIKASLEAIKIERAGIHALQLFNTGEQRVALVYARKAGEDLEKLLQSWKSLIKDEPELPKQLATSPLLALQTILSQIRERHIFKNHTSSVTTVCISADSRHLATASLDKMAILYNLHTGEKLHTFTDHTNSVNSVCISADSRYLATASDDKTAIVYNLETGEKLHTLTSHTDVVWSVCISADSHYLATASWDKTVKVWDVEGNLIADFVGYQEGGQFIEMKTPALSVAFTPDGKHLAAGYKDGVVRLWRLETLPELLDRAREWLSFD